MVQIAALCTCGGDADGVCGAGGFVFVWNCMHLWALSIGLHLFDCARTNDNNYGSMCVCLCACVYICIIHILHIWVNVAVAHLMTHSVLFKKYCWRFILIKSILR